MSYLRRPPGRGSRGACRRTRPPWHRDPDPPVRWAPRTGRPPPGRRVDPDRHRHAPDRRRAATGHGYCL